MTTAATVDVPSDSRASVIQLMDDQLRARLVERILKDLEFRQHFGAETRIVQRSWAERIMDGTVIYLKLCADSLSGEPFSPSPLVDIGWHCFILYTREYAEFCERLAGRFIHHAPSDVPGVVYAFKGSTDKTVAALQARGLPVDAGIWVGAAACDDDEGKCCDWHDPKKK